MKKFQNIVENGISYQSGAKRQKKDYDFLKQLKHGTTNRTFLVLICNVSDEMESSAREATSPCKLKDLEVNYDKCATTSSLGTSAFSPICWERELQPHTGIWSKSKSKTWRSHGLPSISIFFFSVRVMCFVEFLWVHGGLTSGFYMMTVSMGPTDLKKKKKSQGVQ